MDPFWMKKFPILLLIAAAASAKLQNDAFYKIENRDGDVLSLDPANPASADGILAKWTGCLEQKWKAIESVCRHNATSHSSDCTPVSHQNETNALQDVLDADSHTLEIYESNSTCNTKYWVVKDLDAEGRVQQIQNYVLGTCVSSRGLNRPVKLMPCDGSQSMQWKFTKLP